MHDEVTGNIYQRAREYSPRLGRFLQRDPLGYPDGMNTYAAYHVMRGGVDPYGLAYKYLEREDHDTEKTKDVSKGFGWKKLKNEFLTPGFSAEVSNSRSETDTTEGSNKVYVSAYLKAESLGPVAAGAETGAEFSTTWSSAEAHAIKRSINSNIGWERKYQLHQLQTTETTTTGIMHEILDRWCADSGRYFQAIKNTAKVRAETQDGLQDVFVMIKDFKMKGDCLVVTTLVRGFKDIESDTITLKGMMHIKQLLMVSQRQRSQCLI